MGNFILAFISPSDLQTVEGCDSPFFSIITMYYQQRTSPLVLEYGVMREVLDTINCTKYIYIFFRVANFLCTACGVKPGGRIIVILPRIPQWWLVNIAAMRIGMF